MPSLHPPAHPHPAKRFYSLGEAARAGMLIVVRCNLCRRTVHYLAADLVEVGAPPKRPARSWAGACRQCGKSDYLRVDLRAPHPGDVGQLIVRRPGPARVVREWRDLPL